MEPQKICMSYTFAVHSWLEKKHLQGIFLSNGDVQQPSVFFGDFPGNTRCGTNGTSLLFPKRVSSSSTFGKPGGNTMGIQLVSWWPGGLSHPLEKKKRMRKFLIGSFSPSFRVIFLFFKWNQCSPKVFNSCSPEKKSYQAPRGKEKDPLPIPLPPSCWGSFLVWLAWHFREVSLWKNQHFHSFIHWFFPSFFRGQAENEHFFMWNKCAGNKKWIENGFLHIGNWTFATCWKELPFSKSPLVVSILNFHIVSI